MSTSNSDTNHPKQTKHPRQFPLDSQINKTIAGFTDLVELTISRFTGSGYELRLVLANTELAGVHLECSDVSNLKIAEFGGGLTQFVCLRAEDVRAAQLDRVTLQFADLVRGMIAFDCSFASVKSVQIP